MRRLCFQLPIPFIIFKSVLIENLISKENDLMQILSSKVQFKVIDIVPVLLCSSIFIKKYNMHSSVCTQNNWSSKLFVFLRKFWLLWWPHDHNNRIIFPSKIWSDHSTALLFLQMKMSNSLLSDVRQIIVRIYFLWLVMGILELFRFPLNCRIRTKRVSCSSWLNSDR